MFSSDYPDAPAPDRGAVVIAIVAGALSGGIVGFVMGISFFVLSLSH